MNNYDDILETTATPKVDNRPQWQIRQQQNRDYAYQTSDGALDEFAQGTGDFRSYLDVQSKFLGYSVRNALLIMKQNSNAVRLGDKSYWRNQGAQVLKEELRHPILILEPGKEYTREDGSVGQYYNAKEVYDISQTSAKEKAMTRISLDERLMLKALISKSPVAITVVDDLPEGRGAFFDHERQTIMVRRGMDASDIFRSVSLELANVELVLQTPKYTRSEQGYKAYAASYLLCRKYGIDTKSYNIEGLNKLYIGKQTQEIAADLAEIRDTAKSIDTRMARALEQGKAAKSQERGR